MDVSSAGSVNPGMSPERKQEVQGKLNGMKVALAMLENELSGDKILPDQTPKQSILNRGAEAKIPTLYMKPATTEKEATGATSPSQQQMSATPQTSSKPMSEASTSGVSSKAVPASKPSVDANPMAEVSSDLSSQRSDQAPELNADGEVASPTGETLYSDASETLVDDSAPPTVAKPADISEEVAAERVTANRQPAAQSSQEATGAAVESAKGDDISAAPVDDTKSEAAEGDFGDVQIDNEKQESALGKLFKEIGRSIRASFRTLGRWIGGPLMNFINTMKGEDWHKPSAEKREEIEAQLSGLKEDLAGYEKSGEKSKAQHTKHLITDLEQALKTLDTFSTAVDKILKYKGDIQKLGDAIDDNKIKPKEGQTKKEAITEAKEQKEFMEKMLDGYKNSLKRTAEYTQTTHGAHINRK